MTLPTQWSVIDTQLDRLAELDQDSIERLASGECAAIIIRGAFAAAECTSLTRPSHSNKACLFDAEDPQIDTRAIAPDRVDRWTRQGLNPADSQRRRIDIGTSLGNLGDDRDSFLNHSAETHKLFAEIFAGRANPIDVVYSTLQTIAPGHRVVTAYEPDGREYGPAIFRAHYGGYTYGPHFDSVRQREARSDYAVYRFEHQLAGVLCIQNAFGAEPVEETILHRQFWNTEIDPLLHAGTFHDYAAKNNIADARISLAPGDLYFFNTGLIHEVPGVEGNLPRIVLATFIGYSTTDPEIMVWS